MSHPQPTGLPLVLLGAGGHARVLAALVLALGERVIGVCDPSLASQSVSEWNGWPVLGGDEALKAMQPEGVGLINGVGQQPGDVIRARLYGQMKERDFYFPPLVHPTAWVAPDAYLAEGVQVMAGSIIQPGTRVGENSIINTRASIDHDCKVGAHAHVAPGAVLCGSVLLGNECFVGAGATIVQGVCISGRSVVNAGATLSTDLDEGQTYQAALGQLKSF